MLRIEQGIPEEAFTTDDVDLYTYATYHRSLVRALAAYDVGRNTSSSHRIERLKKVARATEHSATLLFQSANIDTSHLLDSWTEVKEQLDLNTTSESWRIKREGAKHYDVPGYDAWSATRTLAKQVKGIAPGKDFRVRERYTIDALDSTNDSEIERLFIDGVMPLSDVFISTATVYALNKAVKRSGMHVDPIDMSRYPEIAAAIK